MEERHRWVHQIKDLRSRHGINIFEAERLALSNPQWRRWVERQINSDTRCRKMALNHLKIHGEEGLVRKDGDVLKVR